MHQSSPSQEHPMPTQTHANDPATSGPAPPDSTSLQGHFQVPEPHAHLQVQGHALSQKNTGIGPGGVSSSQPISISGTANVRKTQQKAPSRPSGSSVSYSPSALKTMELAPAAHRKRPRHPPNRIPDKVAALVPESALYAHLLELESRIDAVVARNTIDIEESLRNPYTVQKTLRLYLYNTFCNQENDPEPSLWTLKIGGRILENGGEEALICGDNNSWYPNFSTFFKKITIYLDQSLYPNNHVILWENARSPSPCDGFEVKRNGSKESTVMLRLEMNYIPEKFKLSPALAEVLGTEVDTHAGVIAALWHYVKFKKLQSSNDSSIFLCDPPLRRVLGEEKMRFAMVPQKISHHLLPPQPIHLEHKIKLSGPSPSGTTCYDVLVDVPLQSRKEMKNLLSEAQKQQEIDGYDETISDTIRKIREHYMRRCFFLGFSESPAEFINVLIDSQSRDLELASRDDGKEQVSSFYDEQWVEDAVLHYLNRKNAAGTDAF